MWLPVFSGVTDWSIMFIVENSNFNLNANRDNIMLQINENLINLELSRLKDIH